MKSYFAFLGHGLFVSLAIVGILLLIFVFEIWMIVSAATNKRISDTAKAWWIIGMILIHPIVAIVYYFTDYQKSR